MNWIHAAIVLALLVGTVAGAAPPPREVVVKHTTRKTGFDCLFPIKDRWISCSRFPGLEASI